MQDTPTIQNRSTHLKQIPNEKGMARLPYKRLGGMRLWKPVAKYKDCLMMHQNGTSCLDPWAFLPRPKPPEILPVLVSSDQTRCSDFSPAK